MGGFRRGYLWQCNLWTLSCILKTLLCKSGIVTNISWSLKLPWSHRSQKWPQSNLSVLTILVTGVLIRVRGREEEKEGTSNTLSGTEIRGWEISVPTRKTTLVWDRTQWSNRNWVHTKIPGWYLLFRENNESFKVLKSEKGSLVLFLV